MANLTGNVNGAERTGKEFSGVEVADSGLDGAWLPSTVTLTSNGRVPPAPEAVRASDHLDVLSSVAAKWTFVGVVSAILSSHAGNHFVPKAAEPWLRRRRALATSSLSIFYLSLIRHTLAEAAGAMKSRRRDSFTEWLRLAARIQRGYDSLVACAADMFPAGRSREEHALKDVGSSFSEVLQASSENEVLELIQAIWKRNSSDIEEVFVGIGGLDSISDIEFAEGDSLLHIQRMDNVTRVDYVHEICCVMERVLCDFMVECPIQGGELRSLVDSMMATLVVLAAWAGPVTETSPFYSRYLRGE